MVNAGGTLLLTVIGGATADARQLSGAAPSLVFDGVAVIDVEQGRLIPDQQVVVEGRHVKAVGAAGAIAVPNHALVVDARGQYLMPGLWDLHLHLDFVRDSIPEVSTYYRLLLANGITGLRDPGAAVPLDRLIQWRREILAGTRVGPPRQIFSGPALDGLTPDCRRTGESYAACVADSADARQVVDSLQAAGADMLKIRTMPEAMSFVLAAEARRRGLPFGGHWEGDPLQAADSGARIIDHGGALFSLTRIGARCFNRDSATVDQCRTVAERFRHQGTWSVPTMTAYAALAEPTPHTIAQHLRDATAAFWADSARPLASRGPGQVTGPGLRDWLHDTAPAPTALPNFDFDLRVAAQAGLPMAMGTDAGGRSAGFSLHAELALAVEKGLTPLAALRAATLEPARIFHATDSLGTIAPGKLADLVLLDANPLADITNTTTIRAVVANGRYYDRPALDRLLGEAQSAAGRQP